MVDGAVKAKAKAKPKPKAKPKAAPRPEAAAEEPASAASEKVSATADAAYEMQMVDPAMREALRVAAGDGIPAISAGNYGGKLGKFHFHLRELLA